MFLNHHKEGKDKVHRHSDLSQHSHRVGRWLVHSLHTHLLRAARKMTLSQARGTAITVFPKGPCSYSWQWNRHSGNDKTVLKIILLSIVDLKAYNFSYTAK